MTEFETMKRKIDKNKIAFSSKPFHLISTTNNIEMHFLTEEGVSYIRNCVHQLLVKEKLFKESNNLSKVTTQRENKGKKQCYHIMRN